MSMGFGHAQPAIVGDEPVIASIREETIMSQIEKMLYTAKVHTTGGRNGASRSSDGRLAFKLLTPGAPDNGTKPAQWFAGLGRHSVRYSLVLVLLWIGAMKFTAYEAAGISGFVANSPLMSWAYSLFSIQGFSALLGVTEIAVALLIAARPLSARVSLVGSALAAGMFLTTLSFLLTTPGVWEASAGGFPALSVVPGQFLVKDFVLFGAALWLFGDDWRALTTSGSHQQQDK
jgi:uncharacterized membrane protein YkgB